jgi:amphi-Trp domain-containing protein
MGESRQFEFEGVASAPEAAEVLRRIAEGLRARSLSLALHGEEISVAPDGELSLRIETSQKRTKGSSGSRSRGTGRIRTTRMGKSRFELARTGSPEEIAGYLESLAAGLCQGEVSLESPDRALRLTPSAPVKLELDVREKAHKGRLEVAIAWKRLRARVSELEVRAGARPATV